jgi:hypothetical protein
MQEDVSVRRHSSQKLLYFISTTANTTSIARIALFTLIYSYCCPKCMKCNKYDEKGESPKNPISHISYPQVIHRQRCPNSFFLIPRFSLPHPAYLAPPSSRARKCRKKNCLYANNILPDGHMLYACTAAHSSVSTTLGGNVPRKARRNKGGQSAYGVEPKLSG